MRRTGDDPGLMKLLALSTMVDKLEGNLHSGLEKGGSDKVVST